MVEWFDFRKISKMSCRRYNYRNNDNDNYDDGLSSSLDAYIIDDFFFD